MSIGNSTKNQHYVSQVEQRLNTSTPSETSNRQRIHTFSISDREQYIISPTSNHLKGVRINENLSIDDLFSFDIASKDTRSNFEILFHAYEDAIGIQTESLLKKLDAGSNDIKDELINLFAAKLLNSFRNPYCIEKTLNTIGIFAEYPPLHSDFAEIIGLIQNGRRPHQKKLCDDLGITKELYTKWLRVLFSVLMRPKGDNNMFEKIIQFLYENEAHHLAVFVFTYTDEHADKHPLLSDRAFFISKQ
jgi:hypothetical protein